MAPRNDNLLNLTQDPELGTQDWVEAFQGQCQNLINFEWRRDQQENSKPKVSGLEALHVNLKPVIKKSEATEVLDNVTQFPASSTDSSTD